MIVFPIVCRLCGERAFYIFGMRGLCSSCGFFREYEISNIKTMKAEVTREGIEFQDGGLK